MKDAAPNPNGRSPVESRDPAVKLAIPYRLRQTHHALSPENLTLADVIDNDGEPSEVLVVVDQGVFDAWPTLESSIRAYGKAHDDVLTFCSQTLVLPGGEQVKNDQRHLMDLLIAMNEAGLCRHSYVLAIGGGAVLDVAGFACSTAHRGVRLIRMPTTTLAQADAGIGVKNGINLFNKKNFFGTFAVPWAVINDDTLLSTLNDRDWRCGFSEAVKVALVKDAAFFERIETRAAELVERDMNAAREIISRSANLHLKHIVEGGDPFEMTAARPLDFGHWSAHKLEQMSAYEIRHGEAVAIGIALDVLYCHEIGLLSENDAQRTLDCLMSLGFALFDPRMNETAALFEGFDEFREHLGGKLTIALIDRIGNQVDVHEIDQIAMHRAIAQLESRAAAGAAARGEH